MRASTVAILAAAGLSGVVAFGWTIAAADPAPLTARAQRSANAGDFVAAARHQRRHLDRRPRDAQGWYDLGWYVRNAGDTPGAIEAWTRSRDLYRARIDSMLRDDPTLSSVWYNLACCEALVGDAEAAIDALDRAVALGWANARHAERDPDLALVRADPRFVALLARMRSAPTGARVLDGT